MSIAEKYRVPTGSQVDLGRYPTSDHDGLEREAVEEQTKDNAKAIADLQHRLYAQHTQSLLIVLQAMDAGGKDSSIRHVFDRTNPQGVRVKSFKRPTPDELAHDFLWRIHLHTPRRGHISIFNRSHYEDVVAARVEGTVPEAKWSQRYESINGFERALNNADTTIVKIYLHISKERQRQKLRKRLLDPDKSWKFEEGDLRTREKWDQYMSAYEDAISRCNSDDAPWYIVPTDEKWYRLFVVSQIVRETLERMGPRIPENRIPTDKAIAMLDELS